MPIEPFKDKFPNDFKLAELMKRTGYNVAQRNGQRIYGGPPPNWNSPPPCKGTEVFVGKVPRDMFEWELVPLFETVSKSTAKNVNKSCLLNEISRQVVPNLFTFSKSK